MFHHVVTCRRRIVVFAVLAGLFFASIGADAAPGTADGPSAISPTKAIRLRNDHILTLPGRGNRGSVAAAGAGAASPTAAAGAAGAASGRRVSGLYLIQFEGRLEATGREQLRTLGLELLRYVPDDAFVARLGNASLDQVESLSFVRWVGEYRPEHKVLKSIQDRMKRGGAADGLDVSVLAAPGAAPAELSGVRRGFIRIRGESSGRFGTVLRGRIGPSQLNTLAASPAVLWIEPAPQFRLNDEVASKIVAGDGGPGQLFTQGLGYDGRGVTVAVADSGLDSGDLNNLHPDIAGRVRALLFYGDLTDASDEHSHGTHVAGIVGGNGAVGETDENGALFGLGVAPGVRLVAQRIFDGQGGFQAPPSFGTLTRDALQAGAEIGSNSWGDDTQGRYDLSAMEFDQLVRDADELALGDQPYILEFSAGNAGPGSQTIGSPAVGKNVIATGASVNNRFNLPIEEFTIYDTGQETMADFSSRGPCEDGRIKPDVVAPGTWIASLRSVFANDDNAWWPISENYLYQGGTSQAGPAASGAAAVLVQYWRSTHTNQTPSPALVKALLINSAADMDDSIETDPVPNRDEGWGRVDLTRLIGSSRQHEFVDQSVFLSSGQVSERRILVESPVEPLKITLTYTDVPGFPAAVPTLVNDLDLEVVGPDGVVYRGNQFELGESVPNAPLPDTINNVEAVHLAEPLPGEYLVRVRARMVVQDARAETAALDQDFALVVSGALALPGTGIVAFDRRAYSAPATMKLTLFEQNLAGQSTATISLRSGQEPLGELIVLRAASSSGVFTASVATATGPAVTNGRLEVAQNDFIEAIYEDANPRATRRYFARADLLPPVISGVTMRFEFGREVIAWSTDEEASGILRYGTPNPNLTVTNRFLDFGHEVRLANLTPNVTYRFEIVAEDAAGNRSTNNNNGAYYTFVPTVAPTVLIVDAYKNDLFDIPDLSGYTEPLTRLGVTYEVWDTELDGPVDAGILAGFRAVIWRVAEFSVGTTFSSSDAAAVTAYLANGGSFFVSSMELLSRLEEGGLTSFSRDILGVQSYTADTGVPSVAGSSGEPIGTGINTLLDYTPYEDFIKEFAGIPADASDIMVASTNSSAILVNGSSVVGLRLPRTGVDRPGRVVFLSFPLDAVPSGSGVGNNRAGLLRNILSFLVPTVGESTLALDRQAYTVPGFVTVEVEDRDLAGTASMSVRAFSPRQPSGVNFSLLETVRRGLFRGFIPLELPGQPGGTPSLVVESGDTIRVEYADASAGQTRTVSAMVETTPPNIFGLTVEAGYTEALVSWQTSEPTDALVQFSEAPGSFPINFTAYDGHLDNFHELLIGRLQPETKYYFRVISRDLAGNVTVDDNGEEFHTVTTLRPHYTPWSDQAESDAEWTVITPDISELGWELGAPPSGITAPSPPHVWGTSLDGREAGVGESVLVSPGIYLTGGSRIMLRFRQNYDFIPSDNSEAFEFGIVEIYTNLNAAAVPVATVSDSSLGQWEDMEIDVSAFREQLIYVAWHYALFAFDNASRFGWMIDNVSVSATNIPSGTVTVANNLWQARYVLAGPSGRSGQGENLVLTNARPGTYQIAFGDVPFYTTPPPQTNTLQPSGSILFQGNYVMIDANNNGMSDAWEQTQFGAVSPARNRATDTDRDGFTDYAEFVAGTDPNQPTSALRLHEPIKLVNNSVRLQWPSVPGRGYRVQISHDGVTWFNATNWLLANSTGSSYTELVDLPGATFYRVEVQP
jgi:hypothetical protein